MIALEKLSDAKFLRLSFSG